MDRDKFVWPGSLNPGLWDEFRPSASDVERPFEHISPVELSNAGRALVTDSGWTLDQLDTAVLQTFGRHRRTAGHVRHLRKTGLHLSSPPDAAAVDGHLQSLAGGVRLVVRRSGRQMLVGEMRATWRGDGAGRGHLLILGYLLIPGSHHFEDLPYELLTWQITPEALVGSTTEGRPVRVNSILPEDRTPDLLRYAHDYPRTR